MASTASPAVSPGSSSVYNLLFLKLWDDVPSSQCQLEVLRRLHGDDQLSEDDILELVVKLPEQSGHDVPDGSAGQFKQVRMLIPPSLMSPGYGRDPLILSHIGRLYHQEGKIPEHVIFCAHDQYAKLTEEPFANLLQLMRHHFQGSVISPQERTLVFVLSHSIPETDYTARIAEVKKLLLEHLGLNDCVVVADHDDGAKPASISAVRVPFDPDCFSDTNMISVSPEDRPVIDMLRSLYSQLSCPDLSFTTKTHPINDEILPVPGAARPHLLRIMGAPDTDIVADLLARRWSELPAGEKKTARMKPDELAQKLKRRGHNMENLPSTNHDTMLLFRHLDPDSQMEAMLRKLGLEAPRFAMDLLLGSGYNITADRQAKHDVIDLGPPKLSPVGFCLPQNVIAHDHAIVSYICKVAESQSELQRERLVELGCELDVPSSARLHFGYRKGYNLVTNSNHQKVTSVYEKRLMMLECSPDAPWAKELSKAVEKLPKTYENHDWSNVQRWRSFFHRFGTHYICRAYIGGSITFEITTSTKKDSISQFSEQHAGLNGVINTVVTASTKCDASSNAGNSSTCRDQNINIYAAGGSTSEVVKKLMSCKSEKDFCKALKHWEESIWENPIVSDTSIELGELTDLVCDKDMEVARAMRDALKDYYRGKLRVHKEHYEDSVDTAGSGGNKNNKRWS